MISSKRFRHILGQKRVSDFAKLANRELVDVWQTLVV